MRPDGTVKVLDFGLAKAMERGSGDRSTQTVRDVADDHLAGPDTAGMVLGTAAYMSPEQARGRRGKRADIWAFGVRALRDADRHRLRRRDVSDTLASVLKD